ncbi:MAG: aminotransferase [Alphaproteobacteria bacterium]|nr:aminotransferase [Alphaproteobacteria bacterium]
MTLSVQPHLAAVDAPPIWEAQGWIAGRTFPAQKPLIDVCQAVPGYPPADAQLDHMAAALRLPETHRYTEFGGIARLRDALAADINRSYASGGAVARENIFATAGCNQAFCLVASALAKAGDEIILPLPAYFNYTMWLQMTGVGVRHVPFRVEAHGVPDLSDIRAAITPRTKALVLISPNNPTGAIYAPNYLNAAFELCREAGIALVLDETYRDFLGCEGAPHALFQRGDWQDTLIHLYSFSKVFCLTGYRVGAIVADPKFLDEVGKEMDCVAICPPHIGQIGAAFGLEQLDEWRRVNSAKMSARLEAMRKAFVRGDLGYALVSSGAYFAYLKHPHAGRKSYDVAKRLAERQHVLALPGSIFGPDQDDYIRMAFANVEASAMDDIAARLAADAMDLSW